LFCFLIAGIFPLLIAGLVSDSLSRRILIERNIGEAGQHLERVARFLQDMIGEYESLLNIIAEDPSINEAFARPRPLKAEEKAGLYNTIYLLIAGKRIKPGLHVISGKGELMLSTQNLPAEYDPVQYGNWGLLRRAREAGGRPVIYASGIRNRLGLKEAAGLGRIVSSPGAEDYFVIADLYKAHIGTIIDSIGSGSAVDLDITDRNLIPFYTSGKEIPPERFDIYRRLVYYGEPVRDIYDLGGAPCILVHYEFPVPGIHFFGVQVLSDVLSGTSMGQRIFLILGLGTAVLSFFLAVLIAKNISDPLYEIIRSVIRIKDGEFSQRILISRKDEIGMLADAINGMGSRIESLIENNKNKERSLRLAELRALQAQIHPHFIFNCLDLIKWNAKMGRGDEVSAIVLELGRFLRGSMRNTNEMVSLDDELRMIRDYLAIQKRRFDDRLRFGFSVDQEILAIRLPKFILQPIVENSLVHGIEGKPGPGHIWIRAGRKGEDLEYEIRDDGVGISGETLEKIRAGGAGLSEDQIGLLNVRRRLGFYYGNDFSFVIESSPGGGTRVYIRTPASVREPV
jgi:two-component system sensor histidine kinase YesM